jgi:transposase
MVEALMRRKINYPLPKLTRTCPHCGFVHRSADLLRLNDTQLRCKQCGETVTSVSALKNG